MLRTPSRRATLLALSIVLATLVVYAPVARFPFVTWDDPAVVQLNPHVAHGLTWQSLRWALTSTYNANWLPLTWISHLVDVSLFGTWAGGHHLTNVAIHLLNSLLLFAVLRRLTGALHRSWLVAMLFALHPQHVESVAWVSERKDVLSALFWILTVWAYGDYVRSPRRRRYGLVMSLFVLGALAKPMVVTLPIALLLLDAWPLERTQDREKWWATAFPCSTI